MFDSMITLRCEVRGNGCVYSLNWVLCLLIHVKASDYTFQVRSTYSVPTILPKSYQKGSYLYTWSGRKMKYLNSLTECVPGMPRGTCKRLPRETEDQRAIPWMEGGLCLWVPGSLPWRGQCPQIVLRIQSKPYQKPRWPSLFS